MQIKLTGIFVDDQDKALKFYTDVLGFRRKWISRREVTDGSPWFPRKNRKACNWSLNPTTAITRLRKPINSEIFRHGMPAANFFVGDVQKEYERLKKHGVKFTKEPTKTTGSTIAVLDDTCGNLIQITHFDW